MSRKIIMTLLIVLSRSLYPIESMQNFFDTMYYQDDNKLTNEAQFDTLKLKLEEFIQNGGNVNEFFIHPNDPDVNLTLLMYASFNNNIKLVKCLLEYGANPLLKNNQGVTLFYSISIKLFYIVCYMPCVDMDQCVLSAQKTFEILLDAIDIHEHKDIFKDWVLLIKYLDIEQSLFGEVFISQELDKNELNTLREAPSYLDEWLNGYMYFRLQECSSILFFIPSLLEAQPDSFLKIFKYFIQSLDDSQKEIVCAKLKKYFKKLKQEFDNDLVVVDQILKLI